MVDEGCILLFFYGWGLARQHRLILANRYTFVCLEFASCVLLFGFSQGDPFAPRARVLISEIEIDNFFLFVFNISGVVIISIDSLLNDFNILAVNVGAYACSFAVLFGLDEIDFERRVRIFEFHVLQSTHHAYSL